MTLTFEVPGIPPKEIRGNYHPRNRAMAEARRRASTSWGLDAHYAMVDARNKAKSPQSWRNLSRVSITVTYVLENNRRIDTDNLEGQAMKPVWDAMVHNCLITDDRHQVIYERTYTSAVDRERGPLTIVEVKV